MQDSIKNYVAELQSQSDLLTNDYQKYSYSVQYGKVWAKIIKTAYLGASVSVHTFVHLATGDIYFASSWKQPSKRIVGNVNNSNPLDGVTLHGGRYANDKNSYTYTGSDIL